MADILAKERWVKTKTYPSFLVNLMASGALFTQEATVLVTIVLQYTDYEYNFLTLTTILI